MSKKAILDLDKQNVLLEIEDLSDCCFEVWEEEGKKSSIVRVKMPIKSWEEIVKKWETLKRGGK
jgi:hypothetical protein